MLTIDFMASGHRTLGKPDDVFTRYDMNWFKDDLVKQMVRDIDKCEVVAPRVIESPILGQISPRELSSGVKNLILAYEFPDYVVDAKWCGHNCAKWFIEIGNRKDITIGLPYAMRFGMDFTAKIYNSGEIIHSEDEYIAAMIKYLNQEEKDKHNVFVGLRRD